MKLKNILQYLFAAAAITGFVGCEKEFLDRPPMDALTDANYYQTAEEVLMATAPLYNIVWFDYNDKTSFGIGDARAGNMLSNDWDDYYQFAVPATDGPLTAAYNSFYKIIAQSNMVIRNVKANEANLPAEAVEHAFGEARFMRGLAYSYLVRNWGPVPIIYDNIVQVEDTAIVKNTEASVWEFIIRDLSYASKALPETPIATGRLSKWSAEGMLARMYLAKAGVGGDGGRNQADLDSARHYAADVINNSGLSLFPDYYGLFQSENSNNEESLFSLQWMPIREPWGINNSFQAYMAYDPKVTSTGDGWGRAHGASADLMQYYIAHPEDSIRRKASFMFPSDKHPEILKSEGGHLYEGFPDVANIKKYIIGTPADNGGGAFMAANIKTYMLRLAEVYLIHAEAVLGDAPSTSDQEALASFNAVRERAGLEPKNSITLDDIFQEKRIEFAMEGIYWYELIRLYYFKPEKAMNMINAQDKGPYELSLVEGSNPREWTVEYPTVDDDGNTIVRHYPVSPQTMFLPYPEAEMAKAPNLRKDPVPFDFSVLDED